MPRSDDRLAYRHVAAGKRRSRRRSNWFIDWFDDTGRRCRLFYPTRELRDRARVEKERELNAWIRPPQVLEWGAMVELYSVHLATHAIAGQRRAETVLSHFTTICESPRSDRITPALIDRYFAERGAGHPAVTRTKSGPDGKKQKVSELRPPSTATLQTERRTLRAFFAWATEAKYMPANPLEHMRLPPAARRKRRAPRPEQWVRLLAAAADPDADVDDAQAWHLLILLAAVTGLRQEVLLQIRVGQGERVNYVELGDETSLGIGLLHTYTSKTRSEDFHGLPPVLSDRIAQRIAALPDGTRHLFPWRRFQRRAWERINALAGTRFTFHTLRAAAGTAAALEKARAAGAAHLGHSSSRVFRRHYSDDELIALEVAAQLQLPELPPLPQYVPASARPPRLGRPIGGNE